MVRGKVNKNLKTKRMFVTGSSRTSGTDTTLTSDYSLMSASYASNEYLEDAEFKETQGALIFQMQNFQEDLDDLHSEISSSFYVSQINSGSLISKITTFTARDTTPSVVSGTLFKTANDRGTIITNFDDGVEGQRITILINDANTDFTHDTRAMYLNGGTNWTSCTTGDSIEFVYNGSEWIETNRSDNT